MFLSRYVVSRPSVILELDPATGDVLREFRQPRDWVWDPERPHAHWDRYRGLRVLVYFHEDRLVYQVDAERYVLDASYSSELETHRSLWKRFSLLRDGAVVQRFTYRDPQTHLRSLLLSLVFMDEPWNWDTPFEYVHRQLGSGGKAT